MQRAACITVRSERISLYHGDSLEHDFIEFPRLIHRRHRLDIQTIRPGLYRQERETVSVACDTDEQVSDAGIRHEKLLPCDHESTVFAVCVELHSVEVPVCAVFKQRNCRLQIPRCDRLKILRALSCTARALNECCSGERRKESAR